MLQTYSSISLLVKQIKLWTEPPRLQMSVGFQEILDWIHGNVSELNHRICVYSNLYVIYLGFEALNKCLQYSR